MRPTAKPLVLLLLLSACATRSLSAADPPERAATDPLTQQLFKATQAIQANPKDADAFALRARLYAAGEEHALAVADFDEVLKLEPDRAEAYDQRGSQHFMLGHIEQSIADFDRCIKLRPDEERRHWKRGISYYYAGRYDEGRRQFEGYQTFDDNDVENAVWRFLCMARGQSVAAARESMLKIRRDPRVPMMEIYALYSGKSEPDDVLAAAQADQVSPAERNARLFYAHLYLGLYYEVMGDATRARDHLKVAAEQHKIGHYMWNVADVHARLLARRAN